MQANSRKRPAPGTSPIPNNNQQETYSTFPGASNPSQLSDEQLVAWAANNDMANSVSNPTYPVMADYAQAQQPGTQLVRRNVNNQIVTRDGRLATQPGVEGWSEYEETPPPGFNVGEEDDTELEARAAATKREALSKRPPRQIPPFIQKLVSFLEKNYTNLIRWSDSGDSFIVVDEDQFAQVLIPELFKHKNYASFVRQLNMYGFHKVVGLSDNSMRASEKKSKTPSEYRHRYFKRGRPELLWLIEKPKSGAGNTKRPTKVKQEAHEDEDDENDEAIEGHTEETQAQQRNKDLTAMPKGDVESIRNLRKEVESLQKSQQQIFSILARMRDENNQYIRQASAMVANHERHESSINAILTFLATFYNQSLEGGNGTGSMFSNAIHNNQPQGSVFDVGDYNDSSETPSNQFQNQFQPMTRRPLALLPPPTSSNEDNDRQRAGSTPIATPSTPRPASQTSRRQGQQGSFSSSKPSPKLVTSQSPSQMKDNDDILNVINRSNANAPQTTQPGPDFDFNSALRNYQNANPKGPLTPEQRDAMLSIMANDSGTTAPSITNDAVNNGNDDSNNVNPYLDYFNSNQEQLDMLQRLQEEQDSRVQELAGRLTPLSPSGSIPGLQIPNQSPSSLPYPNAGFDLENFINDDYLNDAGDPAELDSDFDFGQFAGTDNDPGTNDNNMSYFNTTNNAALATSTSGSASTAPSRPQQQQQQQQQEPLPDENPLQPLDSHDASLFGDVDADADSEKIPSISVDGAGAAEYGGPGRIVGSVGSSSGAPTPSVEDADDNNEDDDGEQPAAPDAEQSLPRKRQRTTRR